MVAGSAAVLVDVGDIAEVAALVLGDTDRHAGATYELASPDGHTARDLGEIIARVMDKPIEVREIDADTFTAMALRGADPSTKRHELSAMRAITARYSSHDFVGNPNVLTWLLQNPPTTFEEFVRAQYANFATSIEPSTGWGRRAGNSPTQAVVGGHSAAGRGSP